MPETWAGELGEFRASSSASGGTSLTTTATFIQFPALATPGNKLKGHLIVTPRNFATAVVVKVAFNPWLTILKTTNGMTTAPTDYSIEAQDGSTDTSVDLSSLDTVANGDWVLIGSHQQFRGFRVDVDGTNSTLTTTAAIHFWNGGNWVAYSITDGTKSSTALDQDGLLYWTPTSNWQKITFRTLYPELKHDAYYSDIPMYWVRYSFDKALDSAVTLDSLLAANRSTAYGELLSGQSLEQKFTYGFGGLGNVEALTNDGTANLVVNVVTVKDSEFA